MNGKRRKRPLPPEVLSIQELAFSQAAKGLLGLPAQLDSLYLAGCPLAHFRRVPHRAGWKTVLTLENLSARTRPSKSPECIRDLRKRNRAKH